MRLLIYCDDPGYGGTAINAGLLAAALAASGHEVGLAASTDIAAAAPGVAYFPIDYDTMRLFYKTTVSRVEPEAIFLAARPHLVVFCDGAPDSSLTAKAVCQDWGIPYVVHVNYVAPDHPAALGERLDKVRQANAAALAVAAVSGENLALLRLAFGAPTDRSGVIHYGRPAAFFDPVPTAERQARRRALGLSDADVLCLTVARYEPRKGYRHLCAAAVSLTGHPAGQRLRFAAVGHSIGDGRLQLEKLVAAHGLGGRMALLGQRRDVRQWLGAADIFVLPSESEGMPLSIMEAMGQGLPVIASAVSGIPEQLGETGVLLPDPNLAPEATARTLAETLAALAADPAARRRLGQAARERALRHFTQEAMMASWNGLLDSLASAVAQARPRWPDPAVYAPQNSMPFGHDLLVGQELQDALFLKEGWSHGEGQGRWTEGARARLSLGLPDAAREGFVLEVAGRPYRGGGGPLSVTVSAAGREVGRFVWPGGPDALDAALCCLPGPERFPQQANIVLVVEGASSPAACGESDDARQLGFFLTRLRLSPLGRSRP